MHGSHRYRLELFYLFRTIQLALRLWRNCHTFGNNLPACDVLDLFHLLCMQNKLENLKNERRLSR